MSVRIIPRLDIKGPNLVKGVHLEGLRVLGRPEDFALKYYEAGADELIYIDMVASLYGRNNLAEIVSRAAEQIYIPLTVGGGIRTVEDIQKILRAGADKVAINTAALRNPQLIRDGARAFGSQCIVLYVEAKKRESGQYECLTDNAREKTGVSVFDWIRRAVDLGAGEILLLSVDQEGTGKGYDTELVRQAASLVNVPVIATGGAGNQDHVSEVILEGKADAVCAASILHYKIVEEMGMSGPVRYEEGNVEYLNKRLPIADFGRKNIKTVSIPKLKSHLISQGIHCRRVYPRAALAVSEVTDLEKGVAA